MSKNIQAVRGMHDILPDTSPYWQYLEETVQHVFQSYGYKEIRMPSVEKTELFVRTIGEVTDIVEKEMYTFEDRNGDSLTLRPEGTAGCVRAGIENGLLHNQIQRLWYMGPMFRHERPQKGRYRQFYQAGVEVFGLAGPDVDAELILMTARLWRALGINGLELQINSLGTAEARSTYREQLIEYMSDHSDELDEDSQRRLQSNPLRILDSKNPALQALIAKAPDLTDYLDEASRDHFETLKTFLDSAEIAYKINPRLVRGLDYYEKTVFEWISHNLGAQGTVCAGGRYDGLVERLGGRSTPAVGFAMGLERLISLLKEADISFNNRLHAYMVIIGDAATNQGLLLAESIRNGLKGLSLEVGCGGGSFKSQMKKADKSNASIALILGEDEVAGGRIGIKYLREETPQETISQSGLIEYLVKAIGRM